MKLYFQRYGGISSSNNYQTKKTSPSIGISFGLPIPSPNINPYLNYNGLNLGLFNVNPFFSLQIRKDEAGEKIIHPSVNLHLTPSEHVITKLIGKKHQVKKIILHKKLNNLGPSYPIDPHFYSAPPEVFLPSYNNPIPYPGSLSHFDNYPYSEYSPSYPYPNSNFYPLVDAPPNFSLNEPIHYRSNGNISTINRLSTNTATTKNVVFPHSRSKRTADRPQFNTVSL